MVQQSPAKRQKLTALAEKYGATSNETLQNIDPFISGLTPLESRPSLTVEERLRLKLIEKEQRKMLHGFTTAELHSIEALAPLVDPATTLPLKLTSQPIHTLFEKKRWDPSCLKHEVRYPLGKGRPGYWEAANPLVWEALKPCLRLSSLYVQNAVTWPWWDALLFGDYEFIDNAELESEVHSNEYVKVRKRPRKHWQRPNAAKELDMKFTAAAEMLHFKLGSGHAHYRSGMNNGPDKMSFNPKQKSYTYGETDFSSNWRGDRDNVTINLGFELLEPLMGTSSTSGERAQDIFRIAITIIHELAHAMFMIAVAPSFDNWNFKTEPFYEDECQMELGYSLENTLFHGCPTTFIDAEVLLWSQRHLSCGGIFKLSWNTVFDRDYHNGRHLVLPLPSINLRNSYFQRDIAPIPVWFFLDICKVDYWDTFFRQYQAQATVMGPTPILHRISMTAQGSPPTREVIMNQLKPVDYEDEIMDLFVSNNVAQAVQQENTRRRRALRIQTAITKQRSDRAADKSLTQEFAKGNLPQAPAPPAVNAPPTCHRFTEIRDYLFRNRSDLALDTMISHMPQLLVYRYIMERGGIQITPEEWDSFLAFCEIRKQLFTHMKTAMGVLRRIEAGWPTIPLPARPLPAFRAPSSSNLIIFQDIVNNFAFYENAFCDGMLDHDKEDLRYLCNKYLPTNPDLTLRNEQGEQLDGFDQAMFDSLLHQCYLNQEFLTYGPDGIARWVRPPGEPEDPA